MTARLPLIALLCLLAGCAHVPPPRPPGLTDPEFSQALAEVARCRTLRASRIACPEVCQLADLVCEASQHVCEIAKRHEGDSDYEDPCRSSQGECRDARGECERCK